MVFPGGRGIGSDWTCVVFYFQFFVFIISNKTPRAGPYLAQPFLSLQLVDLSACAGRGICYFYAPRGVDTQ